ncbi:MAG: DUF2339 domain-containing protein [Acidobacteriaceae bacterium]
MAADNREELAQLRRELERISGRLEELAIQASMDAVPSPPLEAPLSSPPRRPLARPGLEARIGSEWLNRIGIVAVLFGVAYFLKFAFESDWIGAGGRVLIGLFAGISVMLWSERFRRHGSPAFSHSLKAIGLGVLYLSLWASFQLYRLVPGAAAFGGMALITGSTLVLALMQDAQVLAGMALLGGMLTPALVSTGENHEVFLFSYLALLSGAAVYLCIRQGWNYLVIGGFLGTLGYYAEWSSSFYSADAFAITLFFVLLFYGIFLAPPVLVAGELPERGGAGALNLMIALLLTNAAAGFFEVYTLFDAPAHRDLLPWVVLAIAAVYLVLSRSSQVAVLRQLHVAVALGLITVAVPLKFHVHFITLGWLVESAVVLYIAARSRSMVLQIGGLAALALAIAKLIGLDEFHPDVAFWNMRVLLFAISIAITALVAHYAREDHQDALWQASAVVVTALALFGFDRELSLAILPFPGTKDQDWHGTEIALNFARSATWLAYGVAAMALGFFKRTAFYRYLALALLAVTTCKVFLYDIEQLNQGYRVISFIALGVILLAVSCAYQRDWLKLGSKQ